MFQRDENALCLMCIFWTLFGGKVAVFGINHGPFLIIVNVSEIWPINIAKHFSLAPVELVDLIAWSANPYKFGQAELSISLWAFGPKLMCMITGMGVLAWIWLHYTCRIEITKINLFIKKKITKKNLKLSK